MKLFESESALCSAFIAAIDASVWTAYAETAGYDILLVRKIDGFQIGIEAKLSLNTLVISQALDEHGHWHVDREGPDCRAVLVPRGTVQQHMGRICCYVGLTVIEMQSKEKYVSETFYPTLPVEGQDFRTDKWFEQAPTKRCRLPDYVPDVPAGASAPLRLTDWKIKAIKLSIIIEKRGHATRSDFKHLQLDHRRWIAPGVEWLMIKDGLFLPGPRMPRFKKAHPKNYKQIKADFEKWVPKEKLPPAKQEILI